MRRFDRVAALSVEGVNRSVIARLEGLSWNTVARSLELAAPLARRFNAKHLRGRELVELQLDDLNTFLQCRKRQAWVFASIDASSRPWPRILMRPRTYRDTSLFVQDVADARRGGGRPLITTGGFKSDAHTIRHVFASACADPGADSQTRPGRVGRPRDSASFIPS